MDYRHTIFVLVGVIFSIVFSSRGSLASVVSTGDFNKDFHVTWSPNHVNTSADGRNRTLVLDKDSGSAFASNDMFLFGQFDMQIKLVPGNSAGTVVAFYLISNQNKRDEVDFEFLGNVAGQPYTLHTNVFTDGFGDREQRIRLWFDPTEDFHTYSVLWNIHQIVFMVDWIPIRTFRNHEDKGVAYPNLQPMGLLASIWDGSSWATNGGRDKINWADAPFVASFRAHKIDACVWTGNVADCSADSPTNWWNNNRSSTLTGPQRRYYKWVRQNYLTYDYCLDNQRFHDQLPKECSLPKY